ncbi:2-dehydro-3-deoxy-D-gluconate 5-dehydrogenase [Emticicia aquatica]|uniref:2-dehydro-3-deoxy-D-gluconate 5-dehydrogenase n=1 Tax=Emticicia aquatica TaxID=1681835 RepID=A0ABM9AM03_9BACT|nr:SDR family oxidoreductase [Emticicia aquatica]CAH0994815.1 2-dehydro-3-deoxy-D-gluconate 5-dehydrogenase [Emticicia aquatica]
MKDLFSLVGKIAVITGASAGMGKAIARILGLNGAKVVISSNDETACSNVFEEFQKEGIQVTAIPCDISVKKEIDFLVSETERQVGKIDILVNCVGIAIPGSFLSINTEDFEKTMQINLQSAIYLTKKVIPSMQQKKDGAIIYLSSLSSVRGNKNLGLYGISKAGLAQLARNLAVEFGPDNIRVNAISPGVIDTEFAKPMTTNSEIMERRIALTPLRRIGKVEEVAGLALLLASKAGGFITGQNIIVDGGTTISDGN